ncbi:MAG: hypothetical protein HGA81_08375 [Chlorobium limicola]|jgi:uncharacterized protein (TIGR02145 family)|nr:hypothetical protein [Chlorobium limicola]
MKRSNKLTRAARLFLVLATLMPCLSVSAAEKTTTAHVRTLAIGTQVWMAENLAVSRYRNGDEIPQVQDAAEWNRLTTGAWCYYENNSANGVTYGKLYNWYAVNDPRGLAPEGWHVPSDNEWQMLVEKTGGEKASGTKLKSTLLWKEPLVGADNSTGFTAIPAGYRSSNGTFSLLGTNSSFWTSSENNSYSAWFRQMYNTYSAVYRVSSTKTQGLSVRCIKN